MSLPNIWHLRKVAESSSKPCLVCYKPVTNVLITPDKRDFFYICSSHLTDRGFCSSIIDEAAVAAKKKKEEQEELDRQKEALKKEYEEKQKKKKEKKAAKDKDKEKDDGKDKDTKDDPEDKSKDPKPTNSNKASESVEEEPRIFALHKSFFQMRVDRIRNNEVAKRNRDRLKSPTAFPSVPSGEL